MKRLLAVVLVLALMVPVAEAVGTGVKDFVNAACNDLVERGTAQGTFPIIDSVNNKVIVLLQFDSVAKSMSNPSSAPLDMLGDLTKAFYDVFRVAVDKADPTCAVYVALTDKAELEDGDSRSIYCVYGTSETSVHGVVWSMADGDEFPEYLDFLLTITDIRPEASAETSAVTVTPTARATIEAQATATPKPAMVWVTSSGSKYHSRSTCSGMKSPKQITKTDAAKQGYSPCKKCYK